MTTTIITEFRINDEEPDVYAMPLVEAPPVLVRPVPQAIYNGGIPTKAIGPCMCECGRDLITQPGIDWWMNRFYEKSGSYDALYATVDVKVYDPLTAQWIDFSNVYMWRPTFQPVARGGYRFRGFRVRFTGLYL